MGDPVPTTLFVEASPPHLHRTVSCGRIGILRFVLVEKCRGLEVWMSWSPCVAARLVPVTFQET